MFQFVCGVCLRAVGAVRRSVALVLAVVTALSLGAGSLLAQTEGTAGSFNIDAPVNMTEVTTSVSDYLSTQMGAVMALAIGVVLIWKLFRWLRRSV